MKKTESKDGFAQQWLSYRPEIKVIDVTIRVRDDRMGVLRDALGDAAVDGAQTLDGDDPRTLYAWTAKGECFRSTNLGAEWDRYAVPWETGAEVLTRLPE